MNTFIVLGSRIIIRTFTHVLHRIDVTLTYTIPITLLLSSKPSYTIKEFINFNVKTNFKNVILLNYELCQFIKGKKNHVHI
jgi:hypothetical protein